MSVNRQTVDEQLKRLKRGVVDLVNEDELRKRLERAREQNRPLRVKLGMDPTGYDLHLGHTVVLRKLRAFQDLGHQAVLIIGDATAMVGDPSGRDRTRPILTRDQVDAFAARWMEQVDMVLDVEALEVRRNSEFFEAMSFSEVIRLCGRMTVARMLERNDFSERYRSGNPISLHEFLYPLMQGWDSVMVQADVELGGTDQLFNLHVGRAFLEAEGRPPQILVTTPIVEGIDGTLKMSKTYQNAIGLSEAPDEMFAKIMSIPDTLMEKYFVQFTDLPETEIRDVLTGHPRDAKVRLGQEVVTWLHDGAAAKTAARRFAEVFAEGKEPEDMPVVELAGADLQHRQLARQLATVKSGGEARRLVSQGGVSLDSVRLDDVDAHVEVKDSAVLKVGKRRFGRIRVV